MAFVDTVETIQQYISVNANFNPDKIKGSLIIAKEYVVAILSSAQYDDLETKYDAENLNASETLVADLVQEALVRLAFWHNSKDGQLEISNAGWHASASKDRKTAWQWQIEDTRRQLKFDGFQALQKLLLKLIALGNALPLWYASDERENMLSLLINDARNFSKYYNIKDNYCLFREMRDAMLYVEQCHILPVLCTDLYENLQAATLANTYTPEQTKLLNYIKPVIAYYTIAESMPNLSALMTEAGIIEGFDTERQTLKATLPARNELISLKIRDAKEKGEASKATLINFLQKNAANYPLYLNSECYTAPSDDNDEISVYPKNKKIVGFY